MAVAENAGPKNDASGKNFESRGNDPERSSNARGNSAKVNGDQVNPLSESHKINRFDSDHLETDHPGDGDFDNDDDAEADDDIRDGCELDSISCGGDEKRSCGFGDNDSKKKITYKSDSKTQHEREMNELVDILSKLNPMAEEFVPLGNNQELFCNGFGYANSFTVQANFGNGNANRRKKSSNNQGRKRSDTRTSVAQRDEMIKRTLYVSDIDHQVTEEQLAGLFSTCGQVVDCRVCGDPNSILRFAFVEFTDEESAKDALKLTGSVLGFYPLRVLPSKTAIAPVNPTFLPRSEDEREMCARTIYCTNIDKKITQAEVRSFFETFCGEVQRLRILGDYHHSTRIAFIEFAMAESAIAALSCSGAYLGTLQIRVSPSKTPVRPRSPRFPLH